eukprot:1721137-Rhodomonas_salina.3
MRVLVSEFAVSLIPGAGFAASAAAAAARTIRHVSTAWPRSNASLHHTPSQYRTWPGSMRRGYASTRHPRKRAPYAMPVPHTRLARHLSPQLRHTLCQYRTSHRPYAMPVPDIAA